MGPAAGLYSAFRGHYFYSVDAAMRALVRMSEAVEPVMSFIYFIPISLTLLVLQRKSKLKIRFHMINLFILLLFWGLYVSVSQYDAALKNKNKNELAIQKITICLQPSTKKKNVLSFSALTDALLVLSHVRKGNKKR